MTGTDRWTRQGLPRWGAPLAALVAAGLVGCGGLLDVSNPNNVPAANTELPVSAAPLVSGAWRVVSFGVANSLLLIGDASDELEFSGSRDGWRELDSGTLSDGFNEFTDNSLGRGGYPGMAQGRWLADYAIRTLEGQQADGTLGSTTTLARAYLIGAIAYVNIADLWDDFVLTTDAGAGDPPVGEANMQGLYTVAIGYLNKALPLASGELANQIVMVRARAYFNKAVWGLVHAPKRTGAGFVTNSPDVVAAVADAQTALAGASSPDYRFEFTYSSSTGSDWFGSEVNSRQEMRLSPPYVAEVGSNKWGATTLLDPITGQPDVVVDAVQKGFKAASTYVPVTITSTREMHLILAEAALAGVATGNTVQGHINDLRGLDNLTTWDGATPTPQAMIRYERQANLFLMGRRLADMYRFGLTTIRWDPTAQARSPGGYFLPISAQECLSNTNIGAANCSRP